MRKSLWMMVAVLVVIGAPAAHADSFSVTFAGFPPPTAPDVTFPSPTLDVSWQGFAFPIATFPSSWLPTDTYTYLSESACMPSCVASFEITDVTRNSSTGSPEVPLNGGSFVGGGGSLTFTPVATAPEPGSAALMLLGVGLALLLRLRRSPGGQLAA